jgi:hypothetical protein
MISTLTQRWRRGWPVCGRALYTAYIVLRMCREMARKRLHDQHPHTEVEKGLVHVGQSSVYSIYCTAHVQGNGQEEAPRSEPPHRGGEGAARVGQSSIYTAYTVLRLCREMVRKRLHDQHPHTEVEKGLARVGQNSIYRIYYTAHVQGNGQEEAPQSAPSHRGGEGAGPCGAELYIPHLLYCACAGKWPRRGSTISTLTQRWRRGWPVWG